MLQSGLRFRLNTKLELIGSAGAFASLTSNVLFRIMALYSSWMACCQFSFSGLSIASRYDSGSPSEPVSAFVNIGAFHASRYVSGSPSEPVSAFFSSSGHSLLPGTSAGLLPSPSACLLFFLLLHLLSRRSFSFCFFLSLPFWHGVYISLGGLLLPAFSAILTACSTISRFTGFSAILTASVRSRVTSPVPLASVRS